MGDNTTQQKKRKVEWHTSYSTMTVREAEKRLGSRMYELEEMPLDRMLANAKHLEGVDANVILKAKEKVYEQIVQNLEMEGYPTEASADFRVSDLVFSIISPILASFKRKTGREICLQREQEIISTDNETIGMKEFVVIDWMSATEERFILFIQGKRSSVGEAMRQCLLSLKCMRDNNGGGEVYGFIMTGETWQMLRNDGISFQLSQKMHVLFDTIDEDQERWMKDYSILVDCMFGVLSTGGILP
ncbi:hypothetical protein L873DRAFT_1824504 [Choiromyces venosus 120613-1]|uniref:Fungal-type protein kinase domain-containing protein n=1 Tax=Choiromyces venosus 120613-1 TaxID=1336337 RepID=A0A3N4IUL2_9PEZI|nr:hypothetical protein L873DRAFT_1824504 [Choiromyces venosus 120613-1]